MHRLELVESEHLMACHGEARADAQSSYAQPDDGNSHVTRISGLPRAGKGGSVAP